MSPKSKPVVLFVEDEEQHFRAIAVHLGSCRCVRAGARELPQAAALAQRWNPAVAVVDIMLFTPGIAEAESDMKKYLDWLEDLAIRGKRGPAPKYTPKVECKSGADTIPILKSACPSIKVLVCSQTLRGKTEEGLDTVSRQCGADACVAKRFDPYPRLNNGAEIAAKVKELFEKT